MGKSLPVTDRPRRPDWMRVRAPSANTRYFEVKSLVREGNLNTICEEARCPNIAECWGRGTATFQILGDICTRAFRYCFVHSGRPDSPPDPLEPLRSEEHTSELQSHVNLVCRLLLEKKKKKKFISLHKKKKKKKKITM